MKITKIARNLIQLVAFILFAFQMVEAFRKYFSFSTFPSVETKAGKYVMKIIWSWGGGEWMAAWKEMKKEDTDKQGEINCNKNVAEHLIDDFFYGGGGC